MKKIFVIGSIIFLSVTVIASEDNWNEDNIDEQSNSTFEKMKIKNRSKKEYKDKIYKYIKGDYTVENNNIELANIELDDRVRNKDIEINVHVEDLEVIGDEYKDTIKLKRNPYKNFVQHDEKEASFFEEENQIDTNALQSQIKVSDRRREKIMDKDISELETIDLRGDRDVKEVNVFIEDTRIRVDD
jgi:hypothetical protein